MEKKRIQSLILIFIIMMLIVGCSETLNSGIEIPERELTITQIRDRASYQQVDPAMLTPVTEPIMLELGAIGFGVENPNRGISPTSGGVHHLTDRQDTLLAHVENGTEEDRIFIFKLFINYQEIPFYIGDATVADTEFTFLVPAFYEANIPFQLGIELTEGNQTYKLMAVVFEAPHLHVSDDEELIYSFQMALNYDLFLGAGGEITLTESHQEANYQIEWQLAGLGVIGLLDPEAEELFPSIDGVLPIPLQVRRGEMVELAFLGNPVVRVTDGIPDEVDDYVIVMMLDWQQIYPNGSPYLLLTANESRGLLVDYDTFTFLAPEETGLFEFIAIMIPNPTRENSPETFFPVEVAHRFTIEVIE